VATLATLFFVPTVFSYLHRNYRPKSAVQPPSAAVPEA
jgi:hypothetical protein